MSDRYKGAILSPTAPTVTPQSAGGIYTSSQQLQYQGQGVWPTAVNYPINNSLRFRSSASAYLNRTPASAGNQQIFTLSTWLKRGQLGTFQNILSLPNSSTAFRLTDTNTLGMFFNNGNDGFFGTNAVFRDPSAWYHIVLAIDTTQATNTNRIKLYVNGVQQTFSSVSYPSQNYNTAFNTAVLHRIGQYQSSDYLDGYLAEYNLVDGTALTPSSFGTTDAYGIWQPIPYTGAYGTNGFYLPFTDNSALTTSSNVGLGKDFSGNGNYWVTNNISITAGSTYDSMKDVPTNTNSNTANYCVLNPLFDASVSNSNGNLQSVLGTGAISSVSSTMGFTSGKYYCEATFVATGSSGLIVGVTQSTLATASQNNWSTGGVGYRSNNGNSNTNGAGQVAYGATFTTGDVIGIAVDADGGTITFYKNNTSQGALTLPTLASGANWLFSFLNITSAGTQTVAVNFGQQPFTYTPPSGFYPLNTYNLPTPTILAGNQYMDATTFTANASTQVITNAGGFKPDFVWTKSRTDAYSHELYDSVRGVTKVLISNATNAESTDANGLLSLNSNGYTLGYNNGSNYTNGSAGVGWQWQAGQGTTSSNTQGSITSTVSANTTAGFSIVTYTGNSSSAATVGHGLGVKPDFIIIKSRDEVIAWMAWHSALSTQLGYLNLTDAFDGSRYSWALSSTQPTSLLITLGDQSSSGYSTNRNNYKFVAYCFAKVPGYSAFGSYTGNGSTDGTFVFTGFRPKFVMFKCTTTGTTDWVTFDSSRNTYNVTNSALFPNGSYAEQSASDRAVDFLSNGFKIRSSQNYLNGSSDTYIYAAFAENPFKIARAR